MKLLLAGLLTLGITARAESTNMLQTLARQHPRLLVTSNDFARLQRDIATEPNLKTWHNKLVRHASDILTNAPAKYEIPDGLRLLFTSRKVLDRVQTLALLYRLDGDRRYVDRAWQELEAAANFKDWNNRHFLDTAEMTHAFAIGYDWLYDQWTPEQRKTIRDAITKKGLLPARECYRGTSRWKWWVSAHMNWNQVCNGGIGIGALAIADEEPELAGEILNGAVKSLPAAMREYAPAGAWPEGPGYWHYATFYNVTFLAALDTALGTDFGLSQLPGFNVTGDFPWYITGPLNRTFNYADAEDHAIVAPEMFWLARKFHRPDYAAYQLQHAKGEPYDLIWYLPGLAEQGNHPPTLDKYFPHTEVVTMRSAWNDPRAFFVGFKAGSNKVGHSQLDLGTFVLDALGYRWAIDLGRDDYNLPGYFGDQRWNYYRLRAEGHNTLVFNPSEKPDQDPDASTVVSHFVSRSNLCFAVVDLGAAYGVGKVQRSFTFTDRHTLLVTDDIETDKPVDLWWSMHTPAEISLSDDGRIAMLRQGKERMLALMLSSSPGVFTVLDAQPLPGTRHRDRQDKNTGICTLAIHLPDITNVKVGILFAAYGYQ